MSAALISLTYTTDDGKNYNGTYFRRGKVEVSNFTCYSHSGDCPLPVTIQVLSHTYGEVSVATECGEYTDILQLVNHTAVRPAGPV